MNKILKDNLPLPLPIARCRNTELLMPYCIKVFLSNPCRVDKSTEILHSSQIPQYNTDPLKVQSLKKTVLSSRKGEHMQSLQATINSDAFTDNRYNQSDNQSSQGKCILTKHMEIDHKSSNRLQTRVE